MRTLLLLLPQLFYLFSEIKISEGSFAFPADVENLGCFKIQSVRNSSNFDGLYDSLDHCLIPCKNGLSRYFTVHKIGYDNSKPGQLMASTSHQSEKRSLNYICLCGIDLENVLQKVNRSQCECCFNESNCTNNTLCGSLDSGSSALYKVREFNTNDGSLLVPKDAEYLGCFNKSVTNASHTDYPGTTGLDDCLQPCGQNLWRFLAVNEMASYTHPRPREFSCLCRKQFEFQYHLRKFGRKECQCCSDEHNCVNNNICGLSDFGTVSVYQVKAPDSRAQVGSDPSKPDDVTEEIAEGSGLFEYGEETTKSTEQEGRLVNVTTPPKQGETNNDLGAADIKHNCNNSSAKMPKKNAENDLLNTVKNIFGPNTNKTNLVNQTAYQTISIIEKVTYIQVNITGPHEIWNTLTHLRNFSGFS